MSLLGIDIGSSSCKGVAFDASGTSIAKAEVSFRVSASEPGRAELDPEVFWDAVISVARSIGRDTAADPIETMAISSHGETIIPVDGSGKAVGPALMNSDNRALAQAEEFGRELGRERIHSITGLSLHPMFALTKIQWIRDNQPDLFLRARYFIGPADYVLMRMGFPPVTDYSLASRYMAFDILAKSWSSEILAFAGIEADRLPTVLQAGERVGRLSTSCASTLGLLPGVTVSLGGHDQPCGALGAGVVEPGIISDSAGSYECLAVSSGFPQNNARALEFNLNSYCHVVPDQYITLAFFPSGLMVKWFVEQFCEVEALEAKTSGRSVYEVLADKVAAFASTATDIIAFPHLVGSCNPHWDVRATGTISGLTPGVTRIQLYKSLYEGIACELLQNLKALQEVSGDSGPVRIFGGNATAPFSVQLRADITGRSMAVMPHSEMVCQGAAILGGIGSGRFRNVRDTVGFVSAPRRIHSPRVEAAEEYRNRIRRYDELFSYMQPFRDGSV